MSQTSFTKLLNIEVPVICGAMYPCSNVELIAEVSEAGGIGIIQPLSLEYVYKIPLKEGIQQIRKRTSKPVGINILVEKSSQIYEQRMRQWVKTALAEGIRFFITALGNPTWVLEEIKPHGGILFHDVINRKWALKVAPLSVDGLICVNSRAGGHAGTENPKELYEELKDFKLPLICAGGVGGEKDFIEALKLGYDGVQMGTRFIATQECKAHVSYKQAIVQAQEADIVLTDKVTGVPLSVIKTPYIEKIGTHAGPFTRFLLRNPKTKHWMRLLLQLQSIWKLKRSNLKGLSSKDYWQAGKSVGSIHSIESASDVVKRFSSLSFEKNKPVVHV